MRTWIFAGICDKSDLLMYLCKILIQSGKRVLLIDAAHAGKYTHCIRRLDDSMLITEFAGFDVGIGFKQFSDVLVHIKAAGESDYDYILIDAEQESFLTIDDWSAADAKIWVSSFEVAGLMKSASWLDGLSENYGEQERPAFHRIYLNVIEDFTDDEYIESFLGSSRVQWLDDPVRIPWDEITFALKIENEHMGRLRIKPLPKRYKKALVDLVQRLTEMENRQIRRSFRQAERRMA
ncbi:ParA family protein [Paenibacillus dakarensis]|uniref:ParA family protein n=1 Tax=Paenibacillus dakarensis TaxID=1527293 RepID=UPI0006D56366|nr:hypothetical protein [Paenibacillus dakarensis]